ncbi:MAG: hypothetical protein ACJAXL_001531, partial [Alphaproteobacteria bacterium]
TSREERLLKKDFINYLYDITNFNIKFDEVANEASAVIEPKHLTADYKAEVEEFSQSDNIEADIEEIEDEIDETFTDADDIKAKDISALLEQENVSETDSEQRKLIQKYAAAQHAQKMKAPAA